jgi:hypothetical protein
MVPREVLPNHRRTARCELANVRQSPGVIRVIAVKSMIRLVG